MKIDLEAIRKRNEERKRRLFSALARKTAIVLGDPRKAERACDDIDALIAEVERMYAIWDCLDCFMERSHDTEAEPCVDHRRSLTPPA